MSNYKENSQNLKQKTLRGVFWIIAEKGGTQATQFFTILILARLLLPESFGLISLANIFIHFVQTLVDSGFSDAIVQRENLDKRHLDTAFWTNLGVGLFLTAIGFLSASSVATFFDEPVLASIIPWLSLNVLINSFASTQGAFLRRKLNFRGLTYRKIFGLIAGSLVGVSMAFLGFGVWSLVAQTLVTNIIGTLFLWRISGWQPGIEFSIPHLKDLFAFGINVVGINILVFLLRRIDDFLIGYFLGTTALGYYAIAYKLYLTIMQLFLEGGQKVSLPTFSKLQEDRAGLQRTFYSATSITCLVSFPAFLGLAAIAPEIILVLYGEQWGPSVPVMQVLALNGLLVASMTFTGAVIKSLGKPFWSLVLLFTNMVIKALGILFVIQILQADLTLIAVTFVVTNYMLLPARLWTIKHLAGISGIKLAKELLVPSISSIIMVLCVMGTKAVLGNLSATPWFLALYVFVGVFTYGFSAWLISPNLFRKLFSIVITALPIRWLQR